MTAQADAYQCVPEASLMPSNVQKKGPHQAKRTQVINLCNLQSDPPTK